MTPDPLNATVITADVVVDPKETVQREQRANAAVSVPRRASGVCWCSQAHRATNTVSWCVRCRRIRNFEIDRRARQATTVDERHVPIQATGGRGATLVSGFSDARGARIRRRRYRTPKSSQADRDACRLVSVRGGGLFRARPAHLSCSAVSPGRLLEEALPVEFGDRRGGLTTRGQDESGTRNKQMLTPKARPTIMRIGC